MHPGRLETASGPIWIYIPFKLLHERGTNVGLVLSRALNSAEHDVNGADRKQVTSAPVVEALWLI